MGVDLPDYEAGHCTAEEAKAFINDIRRLEMDAAERTLAAFRPTSGTSPIGGTMRGWDLTCPFCEKTNFDYMALAHHIAMRCEKYQKALQEARDAELAFTESLRSMNKTQRGA